MEVRGAQNIHSLGDQTPPRHVTPALMFLGLFLRSPAVPGAVPRCLASTRKSPASAKSRAKALSKASQPPNKRSKMLLHLGCVFPYLQSYRTVSLKVGLGWVLANSSLPSEEVRLEV